MSSNETIHDNEVFYYRWDWNGDSVWDTPISNANSINHRFRRAGMHNILGQVSTGTGISKIVETTIVIEQGYSSPRPFFLITPDSGNLFTEFYFDATSTEDDEDSLNQLQFRWDFGNDGIYETPFSSNPFVKHKFSRMGMYTIKLQVKDPSNKLGTYSANLLVDNIDRDMLPDFTWHTDIERAKEPYFFDASSSSHRLDTSLHFQYSWKFERLEWTKPTYEPKIEHTFNIGGYHKVHLKTINASNGLQNTIIKTVPVNQENKPPEPVITAAIDYGNVRTLFFLHAWYSKDDFVGASGLMYRWDFDGDGNWDTDIGEHIEMHYQFTKAGSYYTRLEAIDPEGKKATTILKLTVSPFYNETSYFMDFRDRQLYGSVKIGNTWWMAENLNYVVPQKLLTGLYTWICLNERSSWCDKVGRLYHVSAVTPNRWSHEYLDVCPHGWRMPLQEDIDELIATIGGPENGLSLEIGGSHDFNGRYLGYADYTFRSEIIDGVIKVVDTIYRFIESYETLYITSETIPVDINELRTDIYMMRIDRNTGEIWNGFNKSNIYVPIRCVKDE